ncbi:hypothetical protein VCRA2123O444_160086 [Vibrio crassostreae]|nr:hypothetical protein VCRA2114O422_160013 [Vibrio crassostreae]CAK1780962.1 hypothetical protein VCRA2119O431_160088 [Vibrio crassostreae]CAK1786314.1 hypothetical protein VCRA2113O409_160091 [Vibrio crassostreae]CAK1793341.1 hypothetical protein VCRA2118O429_160088 [Vibrio crassostreae]CAK1795839.1 hypothetical protein VCRA2113O412_170014 [Vibrio crassostreae]
MVQTHKELGLFSMESGQLLIKSTIDPILGKVYRKDETKV